MGLHFFLSSFAFFNVCFSLPAFLFYSVLFEQNDKAINNFKLL